MVVWKLFWFVFWLLILFYVAEVAAAVLIFLGLLCLLYLLIKACAKLH